MTSREGPLADRVARIQAALGRRGETVAVAESLTGGLLSAALTGAPGSSATFRGGLVVYSADLKTSVAGVPAEVLARYGPVHDVVARWLARGAREVCAADWGVGITGAAGPEPHGDRPAGTVCVGVAHRDGRVWSQTDELAGDRGAVCSAAVFLALGALLEHLDAGEALA